MYTIMLILALIYYPREGTAATSESGQSPPSAIPTDQVMPPYRTARQITFFCAGFAILIACISLVLSFHPNVNDYTAVTCADWIGVSATVASAVQYLPQLYATWKLKVRSDFINLFPSN